MQIDDKIEKEVIRKQERKEEISNSQWKCNGKPTLITLHDHYIHFEDIKSETIIFYKDILNIKKNIDEIEVHAIHGGGWFTFYELVLKTATEDFELLPSEWPHSIESSLELCALADDLYSQIINKMVENK